MSLARMAAVRRPRPVVFSVSLVVAWLLLAVLALGLRRGPIEHELSDRAVSVVRARGQSGVEVTFDGRDATVHGTFPSVSAAEAARRAVAHVPGARSATLGRDVRIVPVTTAAAKPVVIAVDGDSLTVTATVPDRGARERLLAAAAAASSGTLTGRITIDPQVAAPPVIALGEFTRALIAVTGEHKVTVTASVVAVEGTVADTDEGARLGSAVLAAGRAAQPAVILDNRLTVRQTTPTSPASVPVAGWAPSADRLAAAVAEGPVTFATDSSDLTDADRAHLDQIAAVLRDGVLRVLVAGHADARGPRPVNEALSLFRAQAAASYLSSRGVPAARLRAAGFGSDYPVATNGTEVGRAVNRRVEISALAEPVSP